MGTTLDDAIRRIPHGYEWTITAILIRHDAPLKGQMRYYANCWDGALSKSGSRKAKHSGTYNNPADALIDAAAKYGLDLTHD